MQVVNVTWQQPTSPPHTGGSMVFARLCIESKSQTASWSIQPFLYSLWQRVAILRNVPPLFPHNSALYYGESRSLSNAWFLGPTWVHVPNGTLTGSAASAQLTTEHPCTLQWGALSPSKLHILMTGSGPHLTHGSLVPLLVHNPNGISIGSAGLTTMKHRQTDHATHSITVDCIYVHSTATRPDNEAKPQ